MSRVGKQPISIPDKVSVKIGADRSVLVEGPKGKLNWSLPEGVTVVSEGKEVLVTRLNEDRKVRAMHGTTQRLIANMVQGVSQGYRQDLEIHGVGFRAAVKGNVIDLQLGQSHDRLEPQGASRGLNHGVSGISHAASAMRLTKFDCFTECPTSRFSQLHRPHLFFRSRRFWRHDRRRRSERINSARVASQLFMYGLLWIWLAIGPVNRQDWFLEKLLAVGLVAVLVLTYRRFSFSVTSYYLIAAFMMLHAIGAHYTYSEVPFGFWLKDAWGLSRNPFDRIVHFAYGLLLVYPLREVLVRRAGLQGVWIYMMPASGILAQSGFFEIVEASVAMIVSPELGSMYLWTQGDEWDTQKDMAAAFGGAVLTMVFTAWLHKSQELDSARSVWLQRERWPCSVELGWYCDGVRSNDGLGIT